MPLDSLGNYDQVPGAVTAVAGQTIQSAVWDNIHGDVGTALQEIAQLVLEGRAFRNVLSPNGGLEVWQRGAGSSAVISVPASTTAYTADRWYLATGANQAHTVSAVAGIVAGSMLAAAIQRTAAQTGTGLVTFGFPLSTEEVVMLRGQQIALNMFVSTGAAWSPLNGTVHVDFYVGTGNPAKRGGGFPNENHVLSVSSNVAAGSGATNLVGVSSGTVPITATAGELQITWTPNGTAGATDTLNIDDVQLTPAGFEFSYDRLPFQVMLEMCKRHYRKTFPYNVAPAQGAGIPGSLSFMSQAAAQFGVYWQFEPNALRTTAAYTTFNPQGTSSNWQDITGAASIAVSVDTANGSSPSGVLIYGVSVSAADHLVYIQAVADASI